MSSLVRAANILFRAMFPRADGAHDAGCAEFTRPLAADLLVGRPAPELSRLSVPCLRPVRDGANPLTLTRTVCSLCRPEKGATNLHPLPDPRAREGVPLQPLPDAPATDRDRARALPHRAADQDLVPEPAHEVEKGEQEPGQFGEEWRCSLGDGNVSRRPVVSAPRRSSVSPYLFIVEDAVRVWRPTR